MAVILAIACEGKNREMNYTADFPYRGLGATDGIPHRAVADRSSKQGRNIKQFLV